MSTELQVIGKGIYSIPEAARLLRRPPARVRRWANGYTFPRAAGAGRSRPILQTERQNRGVLDFRELIELFFVREFARLDVSIQHIRDTAQALSRKHGPHPFAAADLLTTGRLLIEVTEAGWIAPATGQMVAPFAEAFIQQLDFADGFASLWTPVEGNKQVVVDPSRKLGEPILREAEIPTRWIFNRFIAEQNIGNVAEWFDIEASQVEAAIEFEMRFADAA